MLLRLYFVLTFVLTLSYATFDDGRDHRDSAMAKGQVVYLN